MAVLYVSGYRKSQFVQKDIDLLVALASQTSAALAQTRHLMRAVEAIDRADSGLFRREKVLEKICREVEERFRFDYVAVQLIRPWERIIETVHGTGAASKWLGLAKHLLVDDPDLRDTQADVVLSDPPRIEILAGWDRRADEWIYHRFDHAHYARLCVPIVLVRDQSGKILADRADDWEAQPRSDEDQDGKGHRRTIEVQVPKRYRGEVKLEIIGTLCGGRHDPNAGYLQLKDRISDEEAVDLFKFVALRASAVHRTTLPHVLETVVEYARTMVGADTANLDFSPLEKGDRRYTLEFRAGSLFRDFESRYPWAQQLGAQAIEEQRPVWIHNPSGGEDERDFEGKYPDAFSAGYGAAAAFPLLVEEDIQGVLHIYFQKTHRFSLDEIEWVGIFAQRAVDAIRYAINYTQLRDDAGVLENLHRIADSLVSRPEAKDLLQRIAGSARNILAADVVTLYDYIEPEKRFRGRPDISGRLKTEWKEIMMIGRQAPASLLIDHGKNIYARESVDNPILNKQVNDRKGEQNPPSVAREGIRSTAGILLRLGKEVLGVMFVNYRRPHRFLKQEKEILDIMATAAATAIKNQRLLSTLGEVDREIITTLSLERLLELVVQCAAQITASDVVDLRRLESPVSDGLVVVSRYPKDRRFNSEWRRIQVGRGVTGWVAEHKKPALVRDTDNERCYKNYFPGVRSELSVPLLDAESQLHGVLTVGSDRREAFAASDQRMLEGLASRAVIAIQNADQQRRLTDIQTIKRFGDLAGPFLDRIDKNIGVILDQATRLLDRISGPSRETVQEICGLARPILRDARNLHEWASEGSQSVALDRAVSEALDQVRRTLSIRVDGLETLDGLPLVEAGARQLTDLFVNLVQNAVDAMPNGGTLSIFGHAERNRPWISIQVRDTGCGIDSGQLDSVFKRGYSTKQTEKGLGFGLWWARGYIESLGGYIGVESPAGGWKTIFTLVLPTIQQGKH